MTNNNMFVNRVNGITYLCSLNGQKMIVDKNLEQKSDDEIISYYTSLNVFTINERRC